MRGDVTLMELDDVHILSVQGCVIQISKALLKAGANVDYMGARPYSSVFMEARSHCDVLFALERSKVRIFGQVAQLFVFPGSEVIIEKDAYVSNIYKVKAPRGSKHRRTKLTISKDAYTMEQLTVTLDSAVNLILSSTNNEVDPMVGEKEEL